MDVASLYETDRLFIILFRWDIFDIDEVDEDNLSPVTNSPIALCPRVTPLERLTRDPGFSSETDETSSVDSEFSNSICGTVIGKCCKDCRY